MITEGQDAPYAFIVPDVLDVLGSSYNIAAWLPVTIDRRSERTVYSGDAGSASDMRIGITQGVVEPLNRFRPRDSMTVWCPANGQSSGGSHLADASLV